jgi:hypothetical protein
MLHYFKSILILILFANLISCGIKDKEEPQDEQENEKESTPKTEFSEIDSTNIDDSDSIETSNKTVVWKKTMTQKKDGTITYDSIAVTVEKPKKSTKEKEEIEKSTSLLKKIIEQSKVGETITQEELITDYNTPKDAAKLIKTITKTSQDELEIKWGSTWFVEKVSDAKFKDGKIKLRFKGETMYTSGKAIGIKFNKKIYTDLIVIGKKTRIPGIKGFYWEIGK